MSVAEDAQPPPQSCENSRIYSQTKKAIWKRATYNSKPQVRDKEKARLKEYKQKKKALEHARLEARHADHYLSK